MTPHLPEDLLQAAADDSLEPGARADVAAHLAACPGCRAEVDGLRALVEEARALPREMEPERDLWDGIAGRIARARSAKRGVRSWRIALPLAALLVIAVAALLLRGPRDRDAWRVAAVAGAPRVAGGAAAPRRVVRPGDRLETGPGGRLALRVGDLGTVELAEGTRARLVAAGPDAQRLALEHGRLSAVILAPPRLFVVETPSAVATDLGCAYDLAVDSLGWGRIHVTEGWVELARRGRVVVVPRGAFAELRGDVGPGTPYVADAPSRLRAALSAFDTGGGAAAVRAALAAARPADAVSVMNLLTATTGAPRALAYERLVALVPPPAGVTREGVLALDQRMLDRWWDRIAPPVLVPVDSTAPVKKKRVRLFSD